MKQGHSGNQSGGFLPSAEALGTVHTPDSHRLFYFVSWRGFFFHLWYIIEENNMEKVFTVRVVQHWIRGPVRL